MRHAVFISHSSRDAGVAGEVYDRLEAAGVPCWMTPRDIPPGALWPDEIAAALERAPAVVVVLSSSSIKSRHVLNEVTEAGRTGAVLLPFRVEDVALPSGLRLHLGTSQWIDAFDGVAPHVPKLVAMARDALRRWDASGPPIIQAAEPRKAPTRAGAWSRLAAHAGVRAGAVAAAVALAAAAGYAALHQPSGGAARDESGVDAPADIRASVTTAAGIVLSVAPEAAWIVESTDDAQVLALRHRRADLRFLAGLDVDTTAGVPAFARAWLGRFASRLPAPLTADRPDSVGPGQWDVPLYLAGARGASARTAAGVLRVLRVPADRGGVVRWWAAVGDTPATLTTHEADVGRLVASFRAAADGGRTR